MTDNAFILTVLVLILLMIAITVLHKRQPLAAPILMFWMGWNVHALLTILTQRGWF